MGSIDYRTWLEGGILEDIRQPDSKGIYLGDSDDVYLIWDGTNLRIDALTDDSLIEIADSASTQKSFDLKWYGNEASGASYLYFDASANLIYTTGVDLQFKDNDYLVIGTGAGASGDVSILWDATNLIINAAADDTLIEIGDSATTQKSFDLKWYGNEASGASYLYLDASANLIYTTGVDLQFKDSDYLVFGTGAGAAGDVSILWDATNLIINAVADDTLIEFGDSATTQLSFDLKWYGNDASGASFAYFDASANAIYTTGIELLVGGQIYEHTTVTSLTSGATVTYSAAQILGGMISDAITLACAATTDTAANIVAAIKNAKVGSSCFFVLKNAAASAIAITLTAGAGITITGTATVAQLNTKIWLVVCTNVTATTEAVTFYSVGTMVH